MSPVPPPGQGGNGTSGPLRWYVADVGRNRRQGRSRRRSSRRRPGARRWRPFALMAGLAIGAYVYREKRLTENERLHPHPPPETLT